MVQSGLGEGVGGRQELGGCSVHTLVFFFSSDVSTPHMIEGPAPAACPCSTALTLDSDKAEKLDTWAVSQIPEEGSRRYSDFPDPAIRAGICM